MTRTTRLTRRSLLRGILHGSAITVGLPLLECFLDSNGEAYADTGQPLPPCFGTWFWASGLIPGFWEPKETGAQYALPAHLAGLEPIKAKINLFSGMQAFLDGKPNQTHFLGGECQATGMVSRGAGEYATSIDASIGAQIGRGTRFRSIEVSCDGDRKSTWSARGTTGMNPSEISPLALYTRIFGPQFRDPNAQDFVPDPAVMVHHSALSVVSDERKALMSEVPAADRVRLDEYFSSVRDLEEQLAVELQKPTPLQACSLPQQPGTESVGAVLDQVQTNNRLFAKLLAHALACGQTRIFNVCAAMALTGVRKAGDPTSYHIYTHEEPIDPALGYQPTCKWFAEQMMHMFREFVQELDSIHEPTGTLLDRTVIFAFTDHGEARVHSMKRFPAFTAGSGGGRMKTGFHIAAEGHPVTRVGFTIQRAFRLPIDSWGTESNMTRDTFKEILV